MPLLGLMQVAPESAEESRYAEARARMVREQLGGFGRDITDQRVLAAMGKVRRHEMVPVNLRSLAYEDGPLPIGHDQTISQPYIVAFMTQALELEKDDKILEIGTGSGYQAAVLAEIADKVYTIEIIPSLAKRARRDLERLGYTNILAKAGNGYEGWPQAAPFDKIIVTCAPEKVPQALVDQLREGGRMIVPVGPQDGVQELILLTKKEGELKRQAVLPVRFVPMTGGSPEE